MKKLLISALFFLISFLGYSQNNFLVYFKEMVYDFTTDSSSYQKISYANEKGVLKCNIPAMPIWIESSNYYSWNIANENLYFIGSVWLLQNSLVMRFYKIPMDDIINTSEKKDSLNFELIHRQRDFIIFDLVEFNKTIGKMAKEDLKSLFYDFVVSNEEEIIMAFQYQSKFYLQSYNPKSKTWSTLLDTESPFKEPFELLHNNGVNYFLTKSGKLYKHFKEDIFYVKATNVDLEKVKIYKKEEGFFCVPRATKITDLKKEENIVPFEFF